VNDIAFLDSLVRLMFRVKEGRRYQLRMRNASDDVHPHPLSSPQLRTHETGRPTSRVMKDVVIAGGYQEMEVDFVADHPGLTRFHRHQQLHMDFGFMALFE